MDSLPQLPSRQREIVHVRHPLDDAQSDASRCAVRGRLGPRVRTDVAVAYSYQYGTVTSAASLPISWRSGEIAPLAESLRPKAVRFPSGTGTAPHIFMPDRGILVVIVEDPLNPCGGVCPFCAAATTLISPAGLGSSKLHGL